MHMYIHVLQNNTVVVPALLTDTIAALRMKNRMALLLGCLLGSLLEDSAAADCMCCVLAKYMHARGTLEYKQYYRKPCTVHGMHLTHMRGYCQATMQDQLQAQAE